MPPGYVPLGGSGVCLRGILAKWGCDMSVQQIMGGFVAGFIAIAAISLLVAPESQTAKIINAFGTNMANILRTAKAYPAAA